MQQPQRDDAPGMRGLPPRGLHEPSELTGRGPLYRHLSVLWVQGPLTVPSMVLLVVL